MSKSTVEKKIAALIYLGAPFTTILVVTSVVSDPVNVTKLLSSGVLAFSIAALLIFKLQKQLWEDAKVLSISLLIIFVTMIWSALNSDSPIQQNIYGTFGRNTGLLAYLAMGLIALGAAVLNDLNYLKKIMYGFGVAGLINIIYCFIAWQFNDPINWSNPYGAILGTFGNPNFISSFLGMVILGITAYMLQPGLNVWYRLILALVSTLALAEIISSKSIQGLVITAFGLTLVTLYKIRSLKIENKGFKITLVYSYVSLALLGGVTALLGALKIGPLAEFIYKPSVTYRGEYWHAGINMALERPLTGVGLDSYGDWYRRARAAQALIAPGPNTVTNAAHNVPIDFLAYGGFPLFIAYMGFISVGAVALLKIVRRQKEFDWIFVSISGIWLAYHLQSIISINQIGLAIWGWLLTGALVSYERITRKNLKSDELKKLNLSKKKAITERNPYFSPSLVAGIGAVVGALIFIPPFNADAQWRSGMVKGDAAQIRKALKSAYMTPSDTMRLIQSIQILEQNKLSDDAYFYAKEAVKFNPESFDAWRTLIAISKSTQEEKGFAMEQMKALDPKNKEIFAANE